MRRYVKQHIGACLHCLLAKTRTGRPAGQLHPIPPASKPFMVIHLDHIGPFITSSKGNKYILVLVDNLPKYVRLDAVRNTNADNVVRKLDEFVCEFGAPERVVSDRGTCFTSSKFEAFCERHGIMHTLNSPRHAQANGQVERVNRTLLPTIMATLDENKQGRDWDRKLKIVARDLNNSENKTTGKTPFELLYGYTPRFDEGLVRQMTVSKEASNYERPELIRTKAIEKIKMEQEKLQGRYDRGRLLNVHDNIGDIVYMSTSPQATGDSTKLHAKNRGPLVVTEILPGDTYGVATLRLDSVGRKYASTAHVSQLKLWKPSADEDIGSLSENDSSDQQTSLSTSQPIMTQDEEPTFALDDDVIHSWNVFLAICALPSLSCGLAYTLLPESPKFLMTRGRNEDALAVLRTVYSINCRKPKLTYPISKLIEEVPQKIGKDNISTTEKENYNKWDSMNNTKIIHFTRKAFKQLKPMFSKIYLGHSLNIYTIQFCILFGLNTVRLWLPQLFTSINEFNKSVKDSEVATDLCAMIEFSVNKTINLQQSKDCSVITSDVTYINTIIVGVSGLIGYFVAGGLINALGNKWLLVFGLVVSGTCGLSIYWATNSLATLILSSVYVTVGSIASTSLLGVIVNQFPTSLRTMVLSIAMMFGRLGALIGNILFPYFMSLGCLPPFCMVGLIMFVAALLGCILPSTHKAALK